MIEGEKDPWLENKYKKYMEKKVEGEGNYSVPELVISYEYKYGNVLERTREYIDLLRKIYR